LTLFFAQFDQLSNKCLPHLRIQTRYPSSPPFFFTCERSLGTPLFFSCDFGVRLKRLMSHMRQRLLLSLFFPFVSNAGQVVCKNLVYFPLPFLTLGVYIPTGRGGNSHGSCFLLSLPFFFSPPALKTRDFDPFFSPQHLQVPCHPFDLYVGIFCNQPLPFSFPFSSFSESFFFIRFEVRFPKVRIRMSVVF